MKGANGEIEEWQAQLWVMPELSFLRQSIPAHKPGEGAVGDCWRTCIACLLNAPEATYVPHFMEQVQHLYPMGGWEALRLARTWLRDELNLDLIESPLDFAVESGAPYILTVQSKVGDWGHCVIARGREVIHDPSGIEGGYTFEDRKPDRNADMLCTPYLPDPDELIRRWAEQEAAELDDIGRNTPPRPVQDGGANDG